MALLLAILAIGFQIFILSHVVAIVLHDEFHSKRASAALQKRVELR